MCRNIKTLHNFEPPATEDEILDETDYFQHDNKELDLEPMLREQLILAVPMSPRCREAALRRP